LGILSWAYHPVALTLVMAEPGAIPRIMGILTKERIKWI